MRRLFTALLVVAVLPGPATAAPTGPTPPPPTPVPPFGSPSPFPSVLETPKPSRRPPALSAAAAALADLDTGEVLWDRRGGKRRPVASLTKIMTVLFALEETTPLEEVDITPRAAAEGGAELGLIAGEHIPVRELLYALMLQSSNDAAVALAEHIGGSVPRFVKRMNRRVRELGLRRTRFASPNGLDDTGYSTARDLLTLTAEAFENERFAQIVRTKRRVIPAPRGPDRRIQNRNALLWLYRGALGVKTGFTSAAGFCLVAAAERDGLRLVAVVLGAPREAFSDAAAVLNHGFRAYERRTVVGEGDALDALRLGGKRVPVAVGEEVEAVLPKKAAVETEVVPAEGLRLPVRDGEVVGELLVSVDGKEVARVPVVATATVRPAPPVRPPWWRRYSAAAATFLLQFLGLAGI